MHAPRNRRVYIFLEKFSRPAGSGALWICGRSAQRFWFGRPRWLRGRFLIEVAALECGGFFGVFLDRTRLRVFGIISDSVDESAAKLLTGVLHERDQCAHTLGCGAVFLHELWTA